MLVRLRTFRGSQLAQVSQPQPTVGTPTLVPVPRKRHVPERSLVSMEGGAVMVVDGRSAARGPFRRLQAGDGSGSFRRNRIPVLEEKP